MPRWIWLSLRVSRYHASVSRKDGMWQIEDAESLNGVVIQGRPLQSGGSPLLGLPSNWNGLFLTRASAHIRGRTLLLGTCALAFEIWPTLPGVCRRIQDSEPIEIGEALGA